MAKDQRGITRKIFSVLDSANADELLLEPLTRVTHKAFTCNLDPSHYAFEFTGTTDGSASDWDNFLDTPFADINDFFGDEKGPDGKYIRKDSRFKAGLVADWKRWAAKFYFLLYNLAQVKSGHVVLCFGRMSDSILQLTASAQDDLLQSRLAFNADCNPVPLPLRHISHGKAEGKDHGQIKFETHPLSNKGEHVIDLKVVNGATRKESHLTIGVMPHVRQAEGGLRKTQGVKDRVKTALRNTLMKEHKRSVRIAPSSFQEQLRNDPIYGPLLVLQPPEVLTQLMENMDVMYYTPSLHATDRNHHVCV